MYQIISYLSYLMRATNQHGVHSPFVYDLVTKCFYNSEKYIEYNLLDKHRKALLKDNSIISVTDFGAGSRIFKSNTRKVSAVAKHAGISAKRQRLLFRLIHYFQPKNTLELGTSLGMATAAMAIGNSNGNVTSVEGCPATSKKAITHLEAFQLQNINILQTSFDNFFQQDTSENLDLVFIDGNHNKKATLGIFEALLMNVHNDSILIFDDIYWSTEMTEAWREIIKHPKVTVSIDTFQWGIIFFRSEQPKQHFVISL